MEKEERLECAESGDCLTSMELSSKLWVKDRFVEVRGIDELMEEVFRMRIKDRERIIAELMIRFIQRNEIDLSLDREYRLALIDEYERRLLPYL